MLHIKAKHMRRAKESFGDMLLKLPWWISALLGIFGFVVIVLGVSIWVGQDSTRRLIAAGIAPLSFLILGLFSIFAAASYWFSKYRERLVDSQNSLMSLHNLSWKQFEFMVAEAYRRQGYAVDYSFNRGADGGIDLTLRREGKTSLVQCKQWKVYSVGVSVVREMFGVLTAEKADEVIIVTTGNFTRDAIEFAAGKPIRLMDGPHVLELVRSVQNESRDNAESDSEKSDQKPPACPQCGKTMVLRLARRGANAGNYFWGCSTYPGCKETLSV
jgi:restriction system protein